MRTAAPVQRLQLEMPRTFHFRAGQYLEVLHPDGAIPLSIASAPWRLPAVHLHYRSTPGVDAARWMDELLQGPPQLRVRGPYGTVGLPGTDNAPLLLIAGGTGVSQVLALVEELGRNAPRSGAVTVLWLVDNAADLYCQAELEAAANGMRVVYLVATGHEPDYPGMGPLQQIAAATPAAHAIVAGSPGFVYRVCDVLVAAGVEPRHMQSDVFSYARRPGFGEG